nr:hypothetical protein [Leifsonia sp. Leaf325]
MNDSGFTPHPNSPASRDEAAHQQYRRRRRYLRAGQLVMLVGALIVAQHWLTHIGAFSAEPPLWADLATGYPMGVALLIVGAVLSARKPT